MTSSISRFVLLLTLPLCVIGKAPSQVPPARQTATNLQPTAPPSVPYLWRDTAMVAGGFITGIVFHPHSPGLLYCRTDIGGAYRWDPAQQRWIPLTDWVTSEDSNLLGIEALALDPTDPRRLYLAAGTYTSQYAHNGAILRSTDQGRTFSRTDVPFKMGGNELGRFSGDRLAVDPASPNILLLGSRNDGLWRSADFGATWKKLDSFPGASTNHVGIISILFAAQPTGAKNPTQIIYAAVSQHRGLFVSRDSGATWSSVEGQPDDLLPTRAVLAADGALYVSFADVPGPSDMKQGAVWRLDLPANRWHEITPRKPSTDGKNFGYSIVALDIQHPGTVLTATMDLYQPHDSVFRSTDRGEHWKDIAGEAPHDSALSPWLRRADGNEAGVGHWIGALAVDPSNPGHVLYGTGETMWGTQEAATTNSPHWAVAANGIEETAVIGLLSPPTGPAHLFSALGDIGGFRHVAMDTTPREGNLRSPLLSNTSSIALATQSPQVMVRVGQVWSGSHHGGISRDGGATWHPFPTEPPSPRGGGSAAISGDGRTILWAPARSSAFLSKDDGATWLPTTGIVGQPDFLSNPSSPKTFFAYVAETGTLYISEDSGLTFTPATTTPRKGRGNHLIFSPTGELWFTSSDGLQHSPNVHAPFVPLPNVQQAYALGFGKADQRKTAPTLFLSGKIAGSAGIFRSTDGGQTWLRLDDAQHHYGWVGVITGDPRIFGRVYLGTNGRGIPYGDPALGN